VSGVLVVGVAMAGLFTASVASMLIERSLRSREVTKLEMSDHLVLCNWSPRALDWIREVHSGIVNDTRLPDRTNMKACLLIGLYRGEKMMLNPVDGEAGPLCEGDELILLSQNLPDLSRLQPGGART
jgi:hypothetical protein